MPKAFRIKRNKSESVSLSEGGHHDSIASVLPSYLGVVLPRSWPMFFWKNWIYKSGWWSLIIVYLFGVFWPRICPLMVFGHALWTAYLRISTSYGCPCEAIWIRIHHPCPVLMWDESEGVCYGYSIYDPHITYPFHYYKNLWYRESLSLYLLS